MEHKNNYWYLASYPKSGNTWIRLFINELTKISEDDNKDSSIKINSSSVI